MNKFAKSYIRNVKKELYAPTEKSRLLLKQLRNEVAAYQQENPDADLQALCDRFGTPEEIASAYIVDAEPQNIKKAINIRKMLVAAVVTIITIVALSFIIALIDNHYSTITNYNETIIDNSVTLSAFFKLLFWSI
ncbi:MAG: hypothetical protein IKJ63_03570 [Clostridia bacterium]|nr:hypothetical protein [Clostridia bacterium]